MLVIYWFYVGSMLVIQLYVGLSIYIPTKFEFLLGEDPPSYPSTWNAKDLTGWRRRLLRSQWKTAWNAEPRNPKTVSDFGENNLGWRQQLMFCLIAMRCIGNLLLGWSWSVFHQISIIPAGWFHQPQVVPPIIMGASAMAWVDPELGDLCPKIQWIFEVNLFKNKCWLTSSQFNFG